MSAGIALAVLGCGGAPVERATTSPSSEMPRPDQEVAVVPAHDPWRSVRTETGIDSLEERAVFTDLAGDRVLYLESEGNGRASGIRTLSDEGWTPIPGLTWGIKPTATLDLSALVLIKQHTIELWDLSRGERVNVRPEVDEVFTIAGSTHEIALLYEDRVEVVSLEAPSPRTIALRTPFPAPTAFSPDGRWLASSYEAEVVLRDAGDGRVRHRVPVEAAGMPSFSPDSTQVIVRSADAVVTVDVASGRKHSRPNALGGERVVSREVFAVPNGFVSKPWGLSEVLLWMRGEELTVLQDPYEDRPRSARVQEDGSLVITTDDEVLRWDANGTFDPDLPRGMPKRTLAVMADEPPVVTALTLGGWASRWDLERGRPVGFEYLGLNGVLRRLRPELPDSRTLDVREDGAALVCEPGPLQLLREGSVPRPIEGTMCSGGDRGRRFGPSGWFVSFRYRDGRSSVARYSRDGAEEHVFFESETDGAVGLDVTDDGSVLVILDSGRVQLFRSTGELAAEWGDRICREPVAWGFDRTTSSLDLACRDSIVRLDVPTLEERARHELPADTSINAIAALPGGDRVAVATPGILRVVGGD